MKQSLVSKKNIGEYLQVVRQDRGYSQEEVASHLGISRQAIGQIEKGERSIDAIELSKLAVLFEVSTDDIIGVNRISVFFKRAGLKTAKNISFNPEKFKQTLLYVLSKLGGKPNFGETVLYKLLYFIDFNAYDQWGESVTGLSYRKLERGPVPVIEQYSRAVDEMENKNELKRFTQEYFGRLQKRYVALADPRMEVFLATEVQMIDRVINELGDKNATQISEYAHGDAPWRLTEDNEIIEYLLVEMRSPSYALRESNQSIVSAAGSDIYKQLGPMEPEESAYYATL